MMHHPVRRRLACSSLLLSLPPASPLKGHGGERDRSLRHRAGGQGLIRDRWAREITRLPIFCFCTSKLSTLQQRALTIFSHRAHQGAALGWSPRSQLPQAQRSPPTARHFSLSDHPPGWRPPSFWTPLLVADAFRCSCRRFQAASLLLCHRRKQCLRPERLSFRPARGLNHPSVGGAGASGSQQSTVCQHSSTCPTFLAAGCHSASWPFSTHHPGRRVLRQQSLQLMRKQTRLMLQAVEETGLACAGLAALHHSCEWWRPSSPRDCSPPLETQCPVVAAFQECRSLRPHYDQGNQSSSPL